VDDLVRFLFEAGQLKRVARSGWWLAGIRAPESVAEHSFRCALIGHFLARRDGRADVARVTMMCLLNDLHEARINDLHKVGQAYIDFPAAESKAFADAVAPMAEGAELLALHEEYQRQETREARLAKDADRIECAFQAREYEAAGCAACRDWFENARGSLTTDAGRALFDALSKADANEWWRSAPRAK